MNFKMSISLVCAVIIVSFACAEAAAPQFPSGYDTSTVSNLRKFDEVTTETTNSSKDCDDVPQLMITIAESEDSTYSVTMYVSTN